jgi:hypothetical protein
VEVTAAIVGLIVALVAAAALAFARWKNKLVGGGEKGGGGGGERE